MGESSLKRERLVVHGHVQGIFFRDNVRRRAQQEGLCGWVRNRRDGTVEAVFEGPSERIARLVAFCVAVTNNFMINRRWTFKATDGSVTFQAPRFLIVSLCALGLNLIVLELLVGVLDVHKVVAQAAAILAATPVNFVGNKLWSFRLVHADGEPAEQ